MLKSDVIEVIGRGAGVDFLIDDAAPFDLVARSLREYLEDNKGLWSGGRITVDVGTRIVSQEQLKELKDIIEQESGLEIVRFSGQTDRLETNAHPTEALDLPKWESPALSTGIPDSFIPTLESVLEMERPAAPPKPPAPGKSQPAIPSGLQTRSGSG